MHETRPNKMMTIMAALAALGAVNMPKISRPTPKKPWQYREDYIKSSSTVKNPKVAAHESNARHLVLQEVLINPRII